MELNILLGAGLDLLTDLLDHGLHVHDALLADVAGELDHLLAHVLTDIHQTLDSHLRVINNIASHIIGIEYTKYLLLSDHHEALFSLRSTCVQSATDGHSLLVEIDPKISDVGDDDVGFGFGLVHLLVAVLAS